MATEISFHAKAPAGSVELDRFRNLDDVLRADGFALESASGATSRRFVSGSAVLDFSLDWTGRPWREWMLHSIDEALLDQRGPDGVAKVLGITSEALGTELGRTFASGGTAVVRDSELTGSVDCLDWCQFFSSRLVAAIGWDRIASAPFTLVKRFSGGGAVALIGESPFHAQKGMQKVADHLGLVLRPVWIRAADGSQRQLPWP